MAKLQYVGSAHRRVIQPEDLTAHGLSDGVTIDMRRGDIVEVPNDVAEWLLSEYSTEARDWVLKDDSDVVTIGSNTLKPPPQGEPLVAGLNPDGSDPTAAVTPQNEALKKSGKT